MVHHFHSKSPRYVIEVTPKENVEFVDHEFITDNDELATKIKDTRSFKNGFISLQASSSIAGANKPTVVSGSRGTDNNDVISQLQKRLEKLEAENAELRKPKRGRPKKEVVEE